MSDTHQYKWSQHVKMLVVHHVDKDRMSCQLQNTAASLQLQPNAGLLTVTGSSQQLTTLLFANIQCTQTRTSDTEKIATLCSTSCKTLENQIADFCCYRQRWQASMTIQRLTTSWTGAKLAYNSRTTVHKTKLNGTRKLTLSSPLVSNGYTANCSGPYWSNPSVLIFWYSCILALRAECQNGQMSKNKKGWVRPVRHWMLRYSLSSQSEKCWTKRVTEAPYEPTTYDHNAANDECLQHTW